MDKLKFITLIILKKLDFQMELRNSYIKMAKKKLILKMELFRKLMKINSKV